MGGDDIFGHIPRKKKDRTPSATAPLPSGGAAVGGSSLPSIPRKKSFTNPTASNTSNTEIMAIPRKKKVKHTTSTGNNSAGSFQKQPQHRSSSTSSFGSLSHHSQQPHKLDRHPLDRLPHERPRKRHSNNGDGHHRSAAPSPLPPPRLQSLDNRNTSSGVQQLFDTVRLPSTDRIRVISENPLVLKIRTDDIPFPRSRTVRQAVKETKESAVADKRKRSVYEELEDTDEEDFMTPEEEKALMARRLKKRLKKQAKEQEMGDTKEGSGFGDTNAASGIASGSDNLMLMSGSANVPAGTTVAVDGLTIAVDPNIVDSPPPGILNSLWYSRECYLHIFVLEKVCGWKTRHKVTLLPDEDVTEKKDEGKDEEKETELSLEKVAFLDANEASALQQKILTNSDFFKDVKARMEISRINPANCPVVLTFAAAGPSKSFSEKVPTTDAGKNDYGNDAVSIAVENVTKPQKKYKIRVEVEREEVLLVKWRGRSYLHCSWERAIDVQKLDPSSNNTARNKIRKFYQSQEASFGPSWKTVLEDERKTAAAIHTHSGAEHVDGVEGEQLDEYFSPQNLEIERILGCDENTMNMEVLAKQRAINIRDEQANVDRKEDSSTNVETLSTVATSATGVANPFQSIIQVVLDTKDKPWDPEDNVRYVVKWKGLPYAEMTWEYWRDIKRDAVDETEDFWHRQQPPDLDEARLIANRPRPHIRDFKKLVESPAYGISERPRPVAKLHGVTSRENTNEDDEIDTDPGFRLRSYQLEGVNWLLFNWFNGRSCVLADEMGLGKTIQSAAFLRELQDRVCGPFLVVAPLSLVGQWQSELASWAPDMNVILYHGSADAREFLVKEEFYYTEQFVPKATASKLKKMNVTKFHVLITTFEVVLKDITVFQKIKWRALLVDEAHRLKNPTSRLFEELAAVPRDYCVLLTGTPIANATDELWALLHFANPHIFEDRDDFLQKFGEMKEAQQVNELHSLLKPYLLRRVKEDVEKSLPPKEETILEVTLTPIQKTFYKAIYERNTSFLFKGAKPNNAPSLMNVMMELRKCCNHPFLIKGAEDRILNEAASKLKDRTDDRGDPISIDYIKLFGEQLVKSSGKMVLLEKLLAKLFSGGHKVLIFSQMVRVLDLLEELLKVQKYRYERLDGTTSAAQRLHAVERFKRKSCQRFVMLLSTRAGGLGLNLTAADVVIIFDSDWNPQNDLQAMARAHRIGQTKAVRVYRLLTAKTYEMHMFHSASLKLGLEKAVLSQNRDQNEDSDENKSKKKSDKEAQAKEIDELLKKGAYDVFRDDDDKEGEKFMETDIDQLLEQSSKKVTYGETATSSLGSGLGSFSKASFVANTDDGEKDVDLDDPDFWSKAVGLDVPDETPEDVAAMIDDGVKRSRKQVQQYDPYAEEREAEKLRLEQLELEKELEKEEKERLRLEKKKKKKEAKLKRKKERGDLENVKPTAETDKYNSDNKEKKKKKKKKIKTLDDSKDAAGDFKKSVKEQKSKPQSKKVERMRALKRAENEDPVIERLKQAWEAPHRNRATAAAIRFGFDRFCKIRNESNLSSLPLQDLESFVSSYVYQLSLQFSVTLLSQLKEDGHLNNIRVLLQEWIGIRCEREIEWICESVQSVMELHLEVESHRRFLRMPMILAEPIYITDLRRGAALRALRRIGILNRLNCLIEECLDSILSGLGHEELGKRGCGVTEISALDADLKARYVTTEELSLAVSAHFRKLELKAPSSWWDRSCDVGLIVGSFVHGLGNYEAMRNNMALPFAEKIRISSRKNLACRIAMQRFRSAASAARRTFDDALESAKMKAELEVQAAVAAAAKAALKREEDAALLRKGGLAAEVAAKNMPETQVENAFEFDGTDSHFVTLPRMHQYLHETLQKESSHAITSSNQIVEAGPEPTKAEDEMESQDDGATGRMKEHHILPMPDSRVLDHRLLRVLEVIEMDVYGDEPDFTLSEPVSWDKSPVVQEMLERRKKVLPLFMRDSNDVISEYSGIGLGGSQCGTSHRSLNDGSDFSFGSASNQLSQAAYGTDAPRFLRAIGVPMNISRFAITGLASADSRCVQELLAKEHARYNGKTGGGSNIKIEAEDPSTPVEVKSNDIPEVAMKAASFDSAYQIPDAFRTDAKLRSAVCLTVIFYGFPGKMASPTEVDSELWKALLHESDTHEISSPPMLLDDENFLSLVSSLAPETDLPDYEVMRNYVENFLMPHCLRLCIYGNGPATRNARGSHGEYETAFGVSIHPEPSQPHPSPLPDPCLTLQEHSLEALGLANALLRRVRLLRTCQFLCTENHISVESIIALMHTNLMGQLSDMPVWWCPWVHDLSLLIQAASGGLFSVITERDDHFIFSPQAVQQHLYSSIVTDDNALPAARHTPPEEVASWAERQAVKFPSLYQMERRLATLCSEATVDQSDELRYHNLPMFDHGGWPRN